MQSCIRCVRDKQPSSRRCMGSLRVSGPCRFREMLLRLRCTRWGRCPRTRFPKPPNAVWFLLWASLSSHTFFSVPREPTPWAHQLISSNSLPHRALAAYSSCGTTGNQLASSFPIISIEYSGVGGYPARSYPQVTCAEPSRLDAVPFVLSSPPGAPRGPACAQSAARDQGGRGARGPVRIGRKVRVHIGAARKRLPVHLTFRQLPWEEPGKDRFFFSYKHK